MQIWLKNNIYRPDGKINDRTCKKEWWIKHNFLSYFKTIYIETSFLDKDETLNERIKYIVNGLTKQRKCICGNSIKLEVNHCSYTCLHNDKIVKEEKKEKKIETSRKNYGYDHPGQNPEVVSKRKKTCQLKYGRNNASQVHISKETLKKLSSSIWLKEQHCTLKKSFAQIGKELSISYVTVGRYIHNHGIETVKHKESSTEIEFRNFIKALYDGEIITNTRAVISPLELDVFLPDLKIAFEYNGEYWHQEIEGKSKFKPIGYHKNKTKLCCSRGIKLYHIWERYWIEDKKRMKSIIDNILK